jgi:cytochrome c oxidase subunit 4
LAIDERIKTEDHMTHDAGVHTKRYLVVFGALVVLTAVTVIVSYLPLPGTLGIAIGVAIAVAKAALVALFFMHLVSERTIVYLALGFSAVFCLALFGLALWTEADHVLGTRFSDAFGGGGRVP